MTANLTLRELKCHMFIITQRKIIWKTEEAGTANSKRPTQTQRAQHTHTAGRRAWGSVLECGDHSSQLSVCPSVRLSYQRLLQNTAALWQALYMYLWCPMKHHVHCPSVISPLPHHYGRVIIHTHTAMRLGAEAAINNRQT